MKDKISNIYIHTHPEFSRCKSGKPCPSLRERGEKTPLGGKG